MTATLKKATIACVLLLGFFAAAMATINNAANKAIVLGDGATTVFTFSFIGDQPGYISVLYTDANGVQTALAQGPGPTQYQLSLNAALPPAIWGIGGTVTYNPNSVPIASGTTLTIVRTLPFVQNISLMNLSSLAALASSTETALDQLEMQIQQLAENLARVVAGPISDPPGLIYTLPPAAQRANTGMAFDSQGNVIAGTTPATGLISSVMQPVVDAASLALGRAAFGLGSSATTSPNCGLTSGVSGAGNLDVNFVTSAVATNQTVTAATCGKVFVATGPITFGLPRANTLWNGFGFWIHVAPVGGNITATINAADKVEGQPAGISGTLYPGSWTYITTNGATNATWYLNGNPYPVFDAIAFGAVGDGTTSNNVAVQNVFTAASAGGHIRFPCGTFKMTAAITMTVANAANVTLEGAGADCTVLLLSGVNGPTINFGGIWSSAVVRNMTIATDGAGAFDGLALNQFHVNGNPARSAQSTVENVVLRGDDAYGASTHFWNHGFADTGVSNISIVNLTYGGVGGSGTGITLQGFVGGAGYAVVANIINSTVEGCAVGVYYGDYFQGVTLSGFNSTGCGYGVQTIASPVGTQSQLAVSNSQINASVCGICVLNPAFNTFMVGTTMFIINANSTGIGMAGAAQFEIVGNNFAATSFTGSIGINMTGGFGQGGVIGNNVFSDLAAAITVGVNVDSAARIYYNRMVSNTADYTLGSGSIDTIIFDANPQNTSHLPACDNRLKFSQFHNIADSSVVTFNGTLAGGGTNVVNAICDASRWIVH